jgi:hypothetical protein
LAALVALVKKDPAIKTWYLAGNGISAATSAPIAEALARSTHLEALWLKMNPIKNGARHFGRQVTHLTGLPL